MGQFLNFDGVIHFMKVPVVGVFFGPYFPVFRLNTVQKNSEYGHFLRSDAQDVLRIANSISQRIYSTEKLLLNTMQKPNPLDN